MELNVKEFICQPSAELLQSSKVRKTDWIELAGHYGVVIKSSWKKLEVKNAVIRKLVDRDVLHVNALALCEAEGGSDDKAVRLLELEVERERLRDREKEREFQLAYLDKKAQLGVGADDQREQSFDLCKNVKLVPFFDEKNPDEFFQ